MPVWSTDFTGLARGAILLILAATLSGCGTFFEAFRRSGPRTTAESIGEIESGYTYIPIDPFPVDSVLPAIVLDIPNVIRYTRPSSRTRTHGTCYRWERCSPP